MSQLQGTEYVLLCCDKSSFKLTQKFLNVHIHLQNLQYEPVRPS